MTWRQLILYILINNLEDEPVYKDGRLLGFKTIREYAVENNTGAETVKALISMGKIKAIKIGETWYIPDKLDLSTFKRED